MAYLSEQFGTDEYWDRFSTRVRPLIGELQSFFEYPWRSGFNSEFSSFERSLGLEVLKHRAPMEHWVLRFLPSTRFPVHVLEIHGSCTFGFSLGQVVAQLHEFCLAEHFMPTSVDCTVGIRRFEFYDAEELVAYIERVTFSPPPSANDRTCGEEFVATLAEGNRGDAALLKMLSGWRGAESLQAIAIPGGSCRAITPPTLEGWVAVATNILTRGQSKNPTLQDARKLVAAVMDAPDFETLEKAWRLHSQTSVYPVLVESVVQGGSALFDFFPDIASALPRFIELATRAVGTNTWVFEAGNYSEGFSLGFRCMLPEKSNIGQRQRSVSLATVSIADHNDLSGGACTAVNEARSDEDQLAALREVFLVARPAVERTQEIDRCNDQQAIYDGPSGLRIVVQGRLSQSTWSENGLVHRGNVIFAFASPGEVDIDDEALGKIHIERIDEHGNAVHRTLSVSLDEAGLLFSAEENAWVLTAGVDFGAPRGIIRDIDYKGLRVLYSVLACNMGAPASDIITQLVTTSRAFTEDLRGLIRDGRVV